MNRSHRSSCVARAAWLRRPNATDVYWVMESQPLRPRCSLQAPNLALSQNCVALVATRRNNASVDALMLAVVAAVLMVRQVRTGPPPETPDSASGEPVPAFSY